MVSASKRNTIVGVVLDALASPNPSLYSTRIPSIVNLSSAFEKESEVFSCSVIVKFSPSLH